MPDGRIFPDLIVHARGQTDENLLVVKIKPGVPRRLDAVDAADARRLGYLTSEAWMPGPSAYRIGACLHLAHDRARPHGSRTARGPAEEGVLTPR